VSTEPRSATPLADSVVRDRLGVPEGVADLLRRFESHARGLRARLEAAAAGAHATEPVRRSAGELAAFLDDAERSVFRRSLRRPLRHLTKGQAGRETLTRAARAAFLRGDRALALQEAMNAFRRDYDAVATGLAAEMPYVTATLLSRARLTEADLARVRRAEDLGPMRLRLRTVDAELRDLREYLPPPAEAEAVQLAPEWPTGVRPQELLALVRFRARAETLKRLKSGSRARLLRESARHVAALGQSGGWSRPASHPGHALAEAVAREALAAAPRAANEPDEPLWSGMVRAARRAMTPGAGGWMPQVGEAPEAPEAEEWGAVQFVTPVFGDFVLAGTSLPSPVRVQERRIKLGERFTCAPHTPLGRWATCAEALDVVQPLFDGLEGDAATYAVEHKAVVVPLARIGDEWLGRVERRGSLRTVAAGGAGVRLRTVRSVEDGVPSAAVTVVDARQPPRVFMGARTRVVEAPYAEFPEAWWKGPEDLSAESADRVAAEGEFFRALAHRLPGRVPRPLGAAVCNGVQGLLYAPTAGVRPAESGLLQRWAAAESMAFVKTFTILWTELGKAGYALGLYHLDAFSIRPAMRASGEVSPRPVIVEAPFGVRLGRPYRRSPPERADAPLYARLGLRRLCPAVEAGEVALPETEVGAFALFMLDMLARAPLAVDPRIPWNELPDAVDAQADTCFSRPKLAVSFARALASPPAARDLVGVIEAFSVRPDD
jgi:hypothetical protein